MSKEILARAMQAKLEGWRKICRKYANSELYGYDSKTGTYEKGCIAKEFENMLISIENVLNKIYR